MKYRSGWRYGRLRSIFKQRREELGLSQRQLATRIRRDKNFVNLFETGDRSMDVVEFLPYCKALRLDPIEVMRQLL